MSECAPFSDRGNKKIFEKNLETIARKATKKLIQQKGRMGSF